MDIKYVKNSSASACGAEIKTEPVLLTRDDGGRIPVLVSVPEGASRIILIVHGLSSSKDSESSTYYRDYFLGAGTSDSRTGVVVYDQPGHGTEEAAEENLSVKASLDSLGTVEAYISGRFPGADICYFCSSFGAYITGLYIRTRPHRGTRAFFRSGAVDFPVLITESPEAKPGSEAMRFMEKNGYYDLVSDDGKSTRFTREFFNELLDENNDLFKLYSESLPDIPVAMAHGECDPVVSPASARRFSEEFGYPLRFFPGEGHSLCTYGETPAEVGELALKFYGIIR